MAHESFTPGDLRAILREVLGTATEVPRTACDLDGDNLDTEFKNLGYDSLALLEAGVLIERGYGIELGDADITGDHTPRAVIDTVNALLARRREEAA